MRCRGIVAGYRADVLQFAEQSRSGCINTQVGSFPSSRSNDKYAADTLRVGIAGFSDDFDI